jgi:hypothetical protein
MALAQNGTRPPTHYLEAALAVLRVVPHDRQRIGRRHVPARRNVRRRPLGRNAEHELDFADVGREAGAATHATSIDAARLADHMACGVLELSAK